MSSSAVPSASATASGKSAILHFETSLHTAHDRTSFLLSLLSSSSPSSSTSSGSLLSPLSSSLLSLEVSLLLSSYAASHPSFLLESEDEDDGHYSGDPRGQRLFNLIFACPSHVAGRVIAASITSKRSFSNFREHEANKNLIIGRLASMAATTADNQNTNIPNKAASALAAAAQHAPLCALDIAVQLATTNASKEAACAAASCAPKQGALAFAEIATQHKHPKKLRTFVMDALLENKGAFLRQIATSQQDDKPSTASRCARVLLAAWIVDMAGNNEAAATCVELASAWLNAKDTEMIAMLALAAPADPSAASAKEWRTAATEAIQPNRVAALSPQSRLVLHHALVLTYATSPPTGTAMDALSAALAALALGAPPTARSSVVVDAACKRFVAAVRASITPDAAAGARAALRAAATAEANTTEAGWRCLALAAVDADVGATAALGTTWLASTQSMKDMSTPLEAACAATECIAALGIVKTEDAASLCHDMPSAAVLGSLYLYRRHAEAMRRGGAPDDVAALAEAARRAPMELILAKLHAHDSPAMLAWSSAASGFDALRFDDAVASLVDEKAARMDNAQVAAEDGDPPSKRRRLGGSGGGGGIVAKSFASELASALAKPGASSSSSSSTNLDATVASVAARTFDDAESMYECWCAMGGQSTGTSAPDKNTLHNAPLLWLALPREVYDCSPTCQFALRALQRSLARLEALCMMEGAGAIAGLDVKAARSAHAATEVAAFQLLLSTPPSECDPTYVTQVCDLMHASFLRRPVVYKLLCFRGFHADWLPTLARAVPSSQSGDRFAAELIASGYRRQSLFGIRLADALGALHATPAGLNASCAAVARVRQAAARGDASFVADALDAIRRAVARYPRSSQLTAPAASLLSQLS